MLTESKFALSLDTQGYGSANGGSTTTTLEPVLFSYFNGTDTEGWAMYLGSLQDPGNGGSGGGGGTVSARPPSRLRGDAGVHAGDAADTWLTVGFQFGSPDNGHYECAHFT